VRPSNTVFPLAALVRFGLDQPRRCAALRLNLVHNFRLRL
jgi:hypothetical protein